MSGAVSQPSRLLPECFHEIYKEAARSLCLAPCSSHLSRGSTQPTCLFLYFSQNATAATQPQKVGHSAACLPLPPTPPLREILGRHGRLPWPVCTHGRPCGRMFCCFYSSKACFVLLHHPLSARIFALFFLLPVFSRPCLAFMPGEGSAIGIPKVDG